MQDGRDCQTIDLLIYSIKMFQLSGFMAQISSERLPYKYTFVFVIEELSLISGCHYYPVSLLSGIDCNINFNNILNL